MNSILANFVNRWNTFTLREKIVLIVLSFIILDYFFIYASQKEQIFVLSFACCIAVLAWGFKSKKPLEKAGKSHFPNGTSTILNLHSQPRQRAGTARSAQTTTKIKFSCDDSNENNRVCAFVFSQDYLQPSTYLIPHIGAKSSDILIPSELNFFFKRNAISILEKGNKVKLLNIVNPKMFDKLQKHSPVSPFKHLLTQTSETYSLNLLNNN